MSQVHSGDAIVLGSDGLAYPAISCPGKAIIGFATSRPTENIDEVRVLILGEPSPSDRLFKMAPGYWVDTPGPYAPPEGDGDVALLDAIEVYLEHR